MTNYVRLGQLHSAFYLRSNADFRYSDSTNKNLDTRVPIAGRNSQIGNNTINLMLQKVAYSVAPVLRTLKESLLLPARVAENIKIKCRQMLLYDEPSLAEE